MAGGTWGTLAAGSIPAAACASVGQQYLRAGTSEPVCYLPVLACNCSCCNTISVNK